MKSLSGHMLEGAVIASIIVLVAAIILSRTAGNGKTNP